MQFGHLPMAEELLAATQDAGTAEQRPALAPYEGDLRSNRRPFS